MLCRIKSAVVSFVGDRRGSQSVEILMILAIAAMTMFGVAQVTGVTTGGTDGGSGIFAGVGELLDQIGLGNYF